MALPMMLYRTVKIRLSNKTKHTTLTNPSQNTAHVSAGHVRVMATMSNDRNAVIKVVVEEWEGSGRQGLGK